MRYPILPLISIGNWPRKLELWQPAPWFWGKNGQVSDQTERLNLKSTLCTGQESIDFMKIND